MTIKELVPGSEVDFCCYVHKIKKAGAEKLLFVRVGKHLLQVSHKTAEGICEGAYIRISGEVKEEKRAEAGIEIIAEEYEVFSKPEKEYPVNIFGKTLDFSTDLKVINRQLTMRHPELYNVFRINSGVSEAFRRYFSEKGFVEIHTPRIMPTALGNEKRTFEFDYFDKKAYLSRNTQLYKQVSAASLDKVFEISSVFKNEKRNSARHLNEFIRMDAEFCFPYSLDEVIKTENELIKFIINHLRDNYKYELENCETELPVFDEIPVIRFVDVFDILDKSCIQSTLDPTDEMRICKYVEEKYKSEFVFITEFPSDKQPFYNLPDEGFTLLFRGVEISNGGRRIYNPKQLRTSIMEKGISEEEVQEYIDLAEYAMPPMGGFSIGLERFVMQLLNLKNIRSASMFPRDIYHMP